MNLTLAARASALRSRLEALDRTASNVAEVNALESLRFGMANRSEKLGAELAKEKLLSGASIVVLTPASLIAMRKRATGLLEKFIADTKANTLKRGQSWSALLDEIDTATRELGSAVMTAWRAHRSSVFAGQSPAEIRGKLARTPENDHAFDDYSTLYSRLKAAFDIFPADAEAIARVSRIAADLERAATTFDFNVPADVKLFLEAVLSIKGAPLSLLTPAVQKWLAENGGSNSYSVRATDRA
jgi:hypothetical protein